MYIDTTNPYSHWYVREVYGYIIKNGPVTLQQIHRQFSIRYGGWIDGWDINNILNTLHEREDIYVTDSKYDVVLDDV